MTITIMPSLKKFGTHAYNKIPYSMYISDFAYVENQQKGAIL